MCTTNWSEFIQNSIAAILPCNHACCIKCLLKQYRTLDDENLNSFRCSICNMSLSKNIFQSVALAFASRNLIESIKLYNEILEYSPKRFNILIVDFLLKHDFDMNIVEDNLWNMASLVDLNQGGFLSGQEKQKMYEEARSPVLALKLDINKIKNQIKSTKDKDTLKILEQNLIELERKEQDAKVNASNDLFERINTLRMNRGICKKKNGFEMYSVDFHGQHVAEAIYKVNELVLPVFDAVRQIEIICGKGNNSRDGVSVLKLALRKYFEEEKNIRCKDLAYNSGAFIIYQ
jgi:DNA-nicking Smr family endonuclease